MKMLFHPLTVKEDGRVVTQARWSSDARLDVLNLPVRRQTAGPLVFRESCGEAAPLHGMPSPKTSANNSLMGMSMERLQGCRRHPQTTRSMNNPLHRQPALSTPRGGSGGTSRLLNASAKSGFGRLGDAGKLRIPAIHRK
jgi:hypothetical protein